MAMRPATAPSGPKGSERLAGAPFSSVEDALAPEPDWVPEELDEPEWDVAVPEGADEETVAGVAIAQSSLAVR